MSNRRTLSRPSPGFVGGSNDADVFVSLDSRPRRGLLGRCPQRGCSDSPGLPRIPPDSCWSDSAWSDSAWISSRSRVQAGRQGAYAGCNTMRFLPLRHLPSRLPCPILRQTRMIRYRHLANRGWPHDQAREDGLGQTPAEPAQKTGTAFPMTDTRWLWQRRTDPTQSSSSRPIQRSLRYNHRRACSTLIRRSRRWLRRTRDGRDASGVRTSCLRR